MDINRETCCGCDVHKDFIVSTIVTFNGIQPVFTKPHPFSTFPSGLRAFGEWLDENNCREVCMESTGKYFVPVFNAVSPGRNAHVVHPKYAKSAGGKDDNKDSKRISELFAYDLMPFSFIPPVEIQELREMTRYRHTLVCEMTAEKNRLQNCLTTGGFKLDAVFSDVFGRTGMDLIVQIVEHGSGKGFDPAPFIRKGIKASREMIDDALDGNLSPAMAAKMGIMLEHCRSLQRAIASVEDTIAKMVVPFSKHFNLALTVPGVSKISAWVILAETGAELKNFPTAGQLCSWAGLVPANRQSAGKKKTTRISEGNRYLGPILVQCALAAIKSRKHCEISDFYNRIKKRRGHMKAVIAVARKLLVAIWHMFTKMEAYCPQVPAEPIPAQPRRMTLNELLAMAREQGIEVTDADLVPTG